MTRGRGPKPYPRRLMRKYSREDLPPPPDSFMLEGYMDFYLASEWSFKLTVALYLFATALYLVFLAARPKWVGRAATAVAVLAVTLHTAGLAFRWIEGGINHPPFTNLYESLLFFAWGIGVFYLVVEWRYGFREGGAFILPIALGAMGAAVLNPSSSKEVQNLMPALQSHWLHAHVAIAAMAYAAFVAAFGASTMFLVKDRVSRRWLGLTANLFMAFMLLISDRFNILINRSFSLNAVTPDGKVTAELVQLVAPGKVLLIAALYFLIAAGFYLFEKEAEAAKEQRGTLLGIPYPTFITALGTIFTAAGLFLLFRAAGRDPGLALFGNPFKIIILCLVAFVGGATVLLDLKLEWVRDILPAASRLDSMSYVIITIAFPLMTMVILTGAVWAKYAFGHYWQWDPKETASLITWIIYTAYLHARVTLNWSPRRVAAISIIGFISVVFTYLGVNAIGTGYHAYASF